MTEPPPPVNIAAHFVLQPKPPPHVPVVDTTVWKEDQELTKSFRELATAPSIDLGVWRAGHTLELESPSRQQRSFRSPCHAPGAKKCN